ncbi:MAG: DivIVA domain-containing protein [Acidobacteria bacterium]|nr:DivIVA domain-containing protein [Acidobacteriota bacterium]
MNVTPLDLRNQQFHTAMRGFDRDEVTAFLAEAADDYAAALSEAERLRQDAARLEGLVNEHRENEKNLRNTLLTAQRLADEVRDNAHQQAAQIVRDAESRADLILEKAQARYEDVQREIDGLRLKRREVETSVESVIGSLRNTIDFVREQEARDRDEKILLHRPRHSETREPSMWGQDRRDDPIVERRA